MSGLMGVQQQQQAAGSSQPLNKPKRSRLELELEEYVADEWCKKHGVKMDVYCCTDDQIICSRCALRDHRGHSIGLVEKERNTKQVAMRNIHAQFREMIQKHENSLKEYKKLLSNISEEARDTEDSSEAAIVCVIDTLQRDFRLLRERIRSHEEAAVSRVKHILDFLPVKLREMKKREAQLSCLAETQSNASFLQQWSSLRHLCEKDLQQGCPEFSQDALLPFTQLKEAVWQFKDQLEEFCEQEFASLAQSALPAVQSRPTVRDTEPKTREEFLKYACDLSLNPCSAHDQLTVFPDLKKVKISKLRGPASPHPERFSVRRQVMCREGLRADRCYFEVEVRGEKAEVALTYKGINRKSGTHLSALGGNKISWSLDISNTYSVSHKCQSVQLTMLRCRPTIGVYLQFKEGALSFYEVAEDMMLLYKMEAKFTEPLYPAFWLGDRTSITICDLKQHRS
ncbi:tripartite motif-containing protein 16-like [Salarias fasciatus]|uniref:Tripartite motif-containing protein 16-like n=1 Tax=Salarias fasciatus TaxID=181472 RepID=A0A672IYI8_SALFA|nr:tripartite motif-containing protein 16-like [Salarias fasciatus]